jgi:hypothetical protein
MGSGSTAAVSAATESTAVASTDETEVAVGTILGRTDLAGHLFGYRSFLES